ncbi:hypothetical protein XFF4834R_chr08010 [Xanthomonas citri pv. fuscans]|nr:hypothetical protein XFF4834R_chr08010 [Xanthomonas citri pv. fuscans]
MPCDFARRRCNTIKTRHPTRTGVGASLFLRARVDRLRQDAVGCSAHTRSHRWTAPRVAAGAFRAAPRTAVGERGWQRRTTCARRTQLLQMAYGRRTAGVDWR